MGLLDLAQHLRLADHLTVEGSGHGEDVAQRFGAGKPVGLGRDLLLRHAGLAGEGAAHGGGGGFGIPGHRLNLAAVAGREEDRLGKPGSSQPGEQLRLAGVLHIERLAQRCRAAPVIDPDDEEVGHAV